MTYAVAQPLVLGINAALDVRRLSLITVSTQESHALPGSFSPDHQRQTSQL